MLEDYVTAKEAAEQIGIEHGSVLAAIRRTQDGTAKYSLPATKIGRDWMVRLSDVEAYKGVERKRGRKNSAERKAGRKGK